MNKILIIVRGGVVQAVHSNENVEIHIVDHDTQGMNEGDLQVYAEDIKVPRSPDSIGAVDEILSKEIEFL